jgi:hypothetical protein
MSVGPVLNPFSNHSKRTVICLSYTTFLTKVEGTCFCLSLKRALEALIAILTHLPALDREGQRKRVLKEVIVIDQSIDKGR